MQKISCYRTRKNGRDILQIISLLLVLPAFLRAQNALGCPDLIRSNKCSCYTFEDGVFLDCQNTITKDVKNALKSASNVQSLSVYDLDDNQEGLGAHFIPQGLCIKHIHIARTNIKDIADDTFMPLRKCLETLSIVSSKIKFMPQKAFSGLLKLMSIDLTSNFLEEIPITAFRNLNKIVQIDLGHNKLQAIPLELLNSVENHIQDISVKDNVLICTCQKNNTWLWIQDHLKIIKPESVTCLNEEYPRERCNVPVISQLSVDKHKDNSVSVSWFIRNRTAIKALQILYYSEDYYSDVKTKYLESTEVSTHITDLEQNMNYVVCIVTLAEEPIVNIDGEEEEEELVNITNAKNITARLTEGAVASILMRSPSSECVSFNTLKKPVTPKLRPDKVFDITTILNRRMGLIVGCSLGFVVFFIMVTILAYTKIKERKRIAKSDPAWSEMNDYHSMHSKDDILEHSNAASTDNILLGMSNKRAISLDR
ncbi:hypothetical protein O0L34_g4334 [Tuta absoluta]|nr:hypothetical protein O0L34_g4334 [Tuta absoluta]